MIDELLIYFIWSFVVITQIGSQTQISRHLIFIKGVHNG